MKKLLGIVFAALIGLHGCDDQPVKPQTQKEPEKSSETAEPASKETKAEANESAPSEEVAAEDYTPALWKIQHKGKKSYLFGSIHMGDKSMYPLPSVVTEAFEASDALAVEIDLSNINQMEMAQKVQQMAIDPENPLETVLKEETLTEYNEYCEETKSPCAMFSTFEPWFAAMTLEALSMQNSGYSEQFGVDMYFLGQARNKKEIIELENIDMQLNMLDGMPLNIQDAFLYSVVTKEGDETVELVEAWKTGNVEAYVESSFEDAKEIGISDEDYSYFMDALLYKRNQSMADGLAKLMEDGKSVFAVVGAAHYGGDKSVNHYLEEKGFTIERVDY